MPPYLKRCLNLPPELFSIFTRSLALLQTFGDKTSRERPFPFAALRAAAHARRRDRQYLQMSGPAQRSTSQEGASFPQEGAGSNVVSTSCPAASYSSTYC